MIECPECGTENPDEALYCKKCGIKLEMPSEQPSSKPDKSWFKSHRDFLTIVILIVGLIAIGVASYGMLSISESPTSTGTSILSVEVTRATYIMDSNSYFVVMDITNNSDKQVTFFPDRFELRLKAAKGQDDIIGYFELEKLEYRGYVDQYIFSPNESAGFMGGFDSYNCAEKSDTFPYELTMEGKIVSGGKERFIKETFSGETVTQIMKD